MRTLEPFTHQWAVLLTSFRRDGTPVGTPVSIAVDGDGGCVRSPGTAWKVKRIARAADRARAVYAARSPHGAGGVRDGPRLDGEEARRAARALRRRHPVLPGILLPPAHRAMRCGTAHFEVRAHDAG